MCAEIEDIDLTQFVKSTAATFNITWDDVVHFMNNPKQFKAEKPSEYAYVFSTVRTRIRWVFRALNLSRSNDMPAPAMDLIERVRVRLASHRNGLIVFVKQGRCFTADASFWFISSELLFAGRDKRNKLCEESGKLSFKYQGLRKKQNLLDVKVEHIKDLEETTKLEGIWCEEFSKNVETKLQTIEADRRQLVAETLELTNSMSIYVYDNPNRFGVPNETR